MALGTVLEIGLCLTLLHHLCYRAGFICSGSNRLGVDRATTKRSKRSGAAALDRT